MKILKNFIGPLLFLGAFISCNSSNDWETSNEESSMQPSNEEGAEIFNENGQVVYDDIQPEKLSVTVADLDSIVEHLSSQNLEVPLTLDLIYGTQLIKKDLLITAFANKKYHLVNKLIVDHQYIEQMSDSLKMSWLFNAIRQKTQKYIEVVVASGANLNFCFDTKYGLRGVMDILIEEDEEEILDYLLSKGLLPNGCATKHYAGSYVPPVARAIVSQNFNMVRLLIGHGADLDVRYSDYGEDCWPCAENITPMHELSMDWYQDNSIKHSIAEYVLRRYAQLNKPNKVEVLSDVLNYSAYTKDTTIAEMLIDGGAKIEFGGNSSLSSAATFSNWTMVRKLLQNGADPNFLINGQGTPAHISLTCCGDGFGDGVTNFSREQTLHYLKMYGADFKTKYELEGYGSFSVEDLMESWGIEID